LGFLDILFNMWALVFVGPSLEGLLGRVRFLAVYVLSAIGGGVMYYFLAPENYPAVGASGAIFGLFGAWFVVSRRLHLDTRGIVVLIAINLAFSFFFHNAIAWQDHVGGLLTGALLTAAYVYAPPRHRADVQAGPDGRADPRRTDLPPRRFRRRRGVDRPLADARLGHDGLLLSKPGEVSQRTFPGAEDLSVAAPRDGRRDQRPTGDGSN